MKRSRSGQRGSAASNFRWRVKSAVAASAMPIGIPGCPLLAASTASIARARMALARRRSVGCMWLRYGVLPARDCGRRCGPLSRPAGEVKSTPRPLREIANLRSGNSMDGEIIVALDRAERALQRIERSFPNRNPAPRRDDELRAKVREVVEELD